MEYGYPTVDQLMHKKATIRSEMLNVKMVIKQFFNFYGNAYDMLNHIISANVGQWQEKRSPSDRFV